MLMGSVLVTFCLFSIINTIPLYFPLPTVELRVYKKQAAHHASYTHFFLYINGFPLFPDFRYKIFAMI